ncbi:hypothetical protein H6G41_09755 [Tolypothrix sp. FACHB-123]|uniref:hypothetical protein n=1 Tax=Tolypothrix sp. FACHB-123 TaxID=2692868 RepID=UPI0016859666|nr:hypothetical protein [Tolypothrix sp. FACHB-123]MBD2354904.1 hypothetical protein [Tolypothrix sp. FACHB-123]
MSTPLLVMQTLPSWGQSLPTNSEVGFEIEGQSQLNQIVIPLFRYVGECPSSAVYATKVTAWFTSSTEPPSKGRRVIIRNISRGMSPDKFPFTDRDYSKGRASESTDIIFGTKHSNNIFVVRENTNEFEYEIRQDNSVVERGQFSAFVSSSSTIQEVPRNRREVDKGYCRVTALFCPKDQWVSKKVRVCPGEE